MGKACAEAAYCGWRDASMGVDYNGKRIPEWNACESARIKHWCAVGKAICWPALEASHAYGEGIADKPAADAAKPKAETKPAMHNGRPVLSLKGRRWAFCKDAP